MNEQRMITPNDVTRKILGSKKYLFICVAYTVALLASLFSAISPNMGFLSEIVGQIAGEEGAAIVEVLSSTTIVFRIIGLLPMIAIAVAYWLVRAGRDSGKPAVKRACLGLVFFKVKLLLSGILLMILTCVIGALGLFGMIGLIISEVEFSGVFGYALMIGVVAYILGCCAFYFLKFFKLLVSLSNTMRLNRNLLEREKTVFFLNWIAAIITVIFSFTAGVGGLVCGVCQALCLILINSCFGDYKNALGFATTENVSAYFEAMATEPYLRETALTFGYMPASANSERLTCQGAAKFKTQFGISVAFDSSEIYIERPAETEESEQIEETEQIGETAETREEESIPAPTEGDANEPVPDWRRRRPAFEMTAHARRERRLRDCFDAIEARVLNLFDNDIEQLQSRFSPLRSYIFGTEMPCPISAVRCDLVLDSVSEKTLLRMAWRNRSDAEITRVVFDIIPKYGERALGTIGAVELEVTGAEGDIIFANYGIMLPDNSNGGTVRVLRVDFADGLFWDRSGVECSFVSEIEEENDEISDDFAESEEAEDIAEHTDPVAVATNRINPVVFAWLALVLSLLIWVMVFLGNTVL